MSPRNGKTRIVAARIEAGTNHSNRSLKILLTRPDFIEACFLQITAKRLIWLCMKSGFDPVRLRLCRRMCGEALPRRSTEICPRAAHLVRAQPQCLLGRRPDQGHSPELM